MRQAAFSFAFLLLGLLGCFAGPANGEEIPPKAKLIQIKVRAVDTLGKPIAGALIEVWQSGDEGWSWWTARRISVNNGKEVHAGDDGSAAVSFSMAVKAGTNRTPHSSFCLTAQAKGYLVTRTGAIDPAPSDNFEVTLTLRRLVSVEGHVVDHQGRPVADATVFHTGNGTPRTEVKTDAQGHFRLDGFPEGKSPIFVAHPAYHFHGQLVDGSAESQKPQPAIKLLPADREPAPLRTLPPLRTHEEEMNEARQTIRPLWEAAMKSAQEGEKGWCSELYAGIEPWVAYDYVNTHLNKQAKNHFVSRQMPRLYAADPEEALAVLESLDTSEEIKAFALLGTVRETPDLSRQQKLNLLDRAAQHLRATPDPEERVFRLSSVAVRLFELGKMEEAKTIVDSLTPTAKQLSPKTNAAACSMAGEAISLFDLHAGLQLIKAARDAGDRYYWVLDWFHVVYRIAKQQPAEAERIAAEAIDFLGRSYPEYYRKNYNRDPSEEEFAGSITYYENRLVPLCYYLASIDSARAERMAAAIHNPRLRAYAVGMIAKALAPSDKAKARKLVLQAYDILAEAGRNPGRRWSERSGLEFGLSTIAAGLLPVVEEIDPTLVGECMWRAVSFRLHRPADDLLLALVPEINEATLAALVARYDRGLAHELLPKAYITVLPAQNDLFAEYYRLPALAMIDVKQAMEKLRADAALPRADASRSFQAAFYFLSLLPIDDPHRWDRLASQHSLWIPDNQYTDKSSFSW